MNGIENVVASGALGISLTGMAIVFVGLVTISLTITALPVVLDLVSRLTERKDTAAEADAALVERETEEKDLASVIGLVMQMEAAFHETEEEKEDIDIAHVIGLVLHLEHERQFGLPN